MKCITYLRDIKKLTIVALLPVLISLAVSGCISTKQAEEAAVKQVLEELRDSGHPTGMFGLTWHMTQQDVRKSLVDCEQLDTNTLVQSRTLYGRPVQVAYSFTDNRLLIIVVSFKEGFHSIEDFAKAFYRVQDYLSRDYGQMPEPIMHELTPATDEVWKDQKCLESTKQMGRITLIHQIKIKDNALGEQILMFLGKEES